MPFYRSIVNHGEFHPGEVVEIAAEQVAEWKGEIELGFLVPEYPAGDITFRDGALEGGWVSAPIPVKELDSEGDAEPVE